MSPSNAVHLRVRQVHNARIISFPVSGINFRSSAEVDYLSHPIVDQPNDRSATARLGIQRSMIIRRVTLQSSLISLLSLPRFGIWIKSTLFSSKWLPPRFPIHKCGLYDRFQTYIKFGRFSSSSVGSRFSPQSLACNRQWKKVKYVSHSTGC